MVSSFGGFLVEFKFTAIFFLSGSGGIVKKYRKMRKIVLNHFLRLWF